MFVVIILSLLSILLIARREGAQIRVFSLCKHCAREKRKNVWLCRIQDESFYACQGKNSQRFSHHFKALKVYKSSIELESEQERER